MLNLFSQNDIKDCVEYIGDKMICDYNINDTEIPYIQPEKDCYKCMYILKNILISEKNGCLISNTP